MKCPAFLLFLAGLAGSMAVNAATCSRQSPAHTVALVELYTSEGCSSCPPADRWLRELAQNFGPDQLVALALHVDYWDYIGWRDRFGDPRFSARQQLLSRLAGGSTIYTPEVFVGMREFRAWRNPAELNEQVRRINARPAGAQIGVQMAARAGNSIEIEATFAMSPQTAAGPQNEGLVVIYEDKLFSEVRAGENRGSRLQHDRVVRYWSAPVAIDPRSGSATWKQSVTLPADWQREKLGVVALVQNGRSGEVLQTVSMPACIPGESTHARQAQRS